MKTKRIFFFLCALFVLLPVFSQEQSEVESIGLTDSDMKNFIKNYSKIDAELEKLNCDMNTLGDSQSDAEKIEVLEQLFQKYGISGPGAFAKVLLIHTDFSIEHYDRGLNSDALTRAIVRKANGGQDPFAGLRQSVNAQDYALVKKYYSELCTVFGEQPYGETKAKSASATGGSTNENYDDELKGAIESGVKEAVKEEASKKAKEDTKKLLKKGARGLLPF